VLGALHVEAAPDAVDALLCLPGELDDVGGLAVPGGAQGDAASGGLPLVPCGVDE
jgi:hypothetical protein